MYIKKQNKNIKRYKHGANIYGKKKQTYKKK